MFCTITVTFDKLISLKKKQKRQNTTDPNLFNDRVKAKRYWKPLLCAFWPIYPFGIHQPLSLHGNKHINLFTKEKSNIEWHEGE